MKKITGLVSALLLSMGVAGLAGCSDGKIHVTFWHTMGSANRALLDRMIAKFNELYPDVKIDHNQAGDYSALYDKLNSAIPAGTMPTMAFCYPDNVADYMASNAVVNIEDYLKDENLKFNEEDGLESDFLESYWKEGLEYQQDGMYSVPYAKSTEVLFYNKTFFNENNLTVPTTWTEMWALCRQIKDVIIPSNPAKYGGIEFPLGYDSDANLFITMCEQRGIPYTTNENISQPSDHVVFNNDQAKAMATELVGYMDEGLFKTKGCLPNNAYTSTYFTESKIVMSIGSTGGTSYQTSNNFEVAVAPAPTMDGNGKYVSQGPSICFFKKGSKEVKEAAWNFYKFIVRAQNTAAYSASTGYEPVRNSAYENTDYQEYLAGDSLQAKTSYATSTIKGRYFTSAVYNGSATARDAVETIFASMYNDQLRLSANEAFAKAYKTATDAAK